MSVTPDNIQEAIVMKILLLGESNVGKTSLVTRYAHDKYDAQNNLLTVGIDIRKINKQLNGRHILLELWDTAGQEKYKTIPTQYFKGIQGILFVYDITDVESFIRIQDWLDKAEQNSDRNLLSMSLIGNKLDMKDIRQVKYQDAQIFAKKHSMKFTQTSAKESINVDNIFQDTMNSILKKGIKCPTKSIRLEPLSQKTRTDKSNSCCK